MRAPVIILIILLFVAVFLWGSVLEPYTGEGMYYTRVQGTQGDQWLDTVLVFDPIESGVQTYRMYNIIYDSGAEDAEPSSVTRLDLKYSGNYFKKIFGPLYLRPTGLHFPIVDFEDGRKFVMTWQLLESVSVNAQGEVIEGAEVTTASHRSTITEKDGGMYFDGLDYKLVDTLPEKVQSYVDLADAAK